MFTFATPFTPTTKIRSDMNNNTCNPNLPNEICLHGNVVNFVFIFTKMISLMICHNRSQIVTMLMVLIVMILMMNDDDDDDGETPHQFVLQFNYINAIFGEIAKMALQIFKQNYSSLLPIYSCYRCVFCNKIHLLSSKIVFNRLQSKHI